MQYLDWVQWPALVITVIAGWLVGSSLRHKRLAGFCCFLVSNVLWVVWGGYAHAYALIALQFFLAITNTHGVLRNRHRH